MDRAEFLSLSIEWVNHTVMCPKDADDLANSVDSDQNAQTALCKKT